MNTFLRIVAEDLYNKVGGNLSRTAVVFPNKRAGLFFNEWLSRCSDKPLWSPAYLTISELFRSMSDLQVADPIRLVCTLYPIFCDETHNETETLDNFYFWGEMLLADFDDLDKNCVDAARLFRNLRELHELIDDHSYLTPEQEEALKMFFHNFSLEKETELKERFLHLWDALGSIYVRFCQTLASEGLAYEGQLYREVIEHAGFDALPYDRYVFVGFNVLSRVEHRLFSRLQAEGKALFYWDYDLAYLNLRGHEAGEFIRRNLKEFPNELTDEALFSNLGKQKRVEFMAAATENIQARYVDEWLRENLTEQANETAVVLCNEALLQPVLHALPTDRLNITMGYPFSGTPIHDLLTLLIDLYVEGYEKRSERYIYRHVSAVLKHPYVRLLSAEAEGLERRLRERYRFFPLPEELHADEVLATLFPAGAPDDGGALCSRLQGVITLVASLFRDTERSETTEGQLAQEAIFKAYTLVNRIESLIRSGLLTLSLETLSRLMGRLMGSLSIPFHGEPVVGLQVMGVLETRNLDFRRVIMLSVNEGKLPKAESNSSFIPYHLRKAFGMTTVEHKNAVYAYYFYRLVQRAEHVTLLYNDTADGLNRGEMSRFMLQYLVEHGDDVRRYALSTSQRIVDRPTIEVSGSREVSERLILRFGGEERYLSPSAINVYLDCRLKFYLRYACRLKRVEEVTTEIESSDFGNIFHRATEIIYKELLGQRSGLVGHEDIEALLKEEWRPGEVVNRAFKEEFFKIPLDQRAEYDGMQLLNKEVITTYVRQLLLRDLRHAPFRFVAAEYPVRKRVTVTPRDGRPPFCITLGGSIDRMDEKEGRLRIVDYKTGSKVQTAKTMEQLFDDADKNRPYHVFQTFLYASLLCEQSDKPLSPALFYIQKAAGEEYVPSVVFGGEAVEEFEPLKQEFDERLHVLLDEMFSPSTVFRQTCIKEHCKYCDFARLCGRGR